MSERSDHPGGPRLRGDYDELTPAYTGRLGVESMPAKILPADGMAPEPTYRFIHDELMLDGSSRLNLATFVTTWMEPQADRLMAETFDKNMIDKDEYPQTAAIESRCVSMVADLFHAPGDPGAASGVSTVGSSEAVMLAGLALKWQWRARRKEAGLDTALPNLVLGSNVQVVWEKFCRYFDVEPRYLPVEPGRYIITPEQVRDAVDEYTIGAVVILGTTFTGELEPVADVVVALEELAAGGGPDVPVHVDAASGGFVVPFLDPNLVWDFRLERVKSINVSGHKYGLTYPGIGFVVWRTPADLPADLVFHVNYLGGDMPTFTLNFSRPGNQVIGQYYNFLRLGRSGYTQVMSSLREIACRLSAQIAEMPEFELLSDGSQLPVFAFTMVGDPGFTVFDVSHELRARGWQVPAYTMPENATEVAVLRVVVREGFSGNLARLFCDDLRSVVKVLHHNGSTGSHAESFAH